jgi:hypothetical protein
MSGATSATALVAVSAALAAVSAATATAVSAALAASLAALAATLTAPPTRFLAELKLNPNGIFFAVTYE